MSMYEASPPPRSGPLMRLRLIRFVIFAIALAAAAVSARAEDDSFGGSFLNPFPQGDVYGLLVIGDDWADGLRSGMAEAFDGDTRVQIRPKPWGLNGLMRPDHAEKLAALEEDLKREPVNAAIVMLGLADRIASRAPDGKRFAVGTPEWRRDYADRADRLLKLLKRRNVAVYWVGQPNLSRPDPSAEAQMMNEVLRERIYLNGMKYIDIFAGFADETGSFDAWGPDLNGKIVRLRSNDGSYFTAAGNAKLAHFVERELKRDINQAKANRSLPLAGAEEEQSRINPDKARLAAEPKPVPRDGVEVQAPPGMTAMAGPAPQPADGDQKADNGKISLKTITGGREEQVTLDVLRPAIPASVIALVTRRESADRASQVGATLIDELAGGLTIMSSVTPSATAGLPGAARQSAAQTPYFRVLFKGERLQARPGRADDVSWPRADAGVEAMPPPRPAAPPRETGSNPAASPTEPSVPEVAPERPRRRKGTD